MPRRPLSGRGARWRRYGEEGCDKRQAQMCRSYSPAASLSLLLDLVTAHLYLNHLSSGERVKGRWRWVRCKRARQQQGECVREGGIQEAKKP